MGEKPMTPADLIKWHQRRADTAAYNADERNLAFHEQAAACIREMVEAQTELAAAARAYFVGWMMDEADDGGPDFTGCSMEQHLAAKRLGEALPPAPGAEDE